MKEELKEKYKKEYIETKEKILVIKKEIQELINKYWYDDNYWSKIMSVISSLYNNRNWWSCSYWEDDSYYYENILEQITDWIDVEYDIKIEDLEDIMELFIERKIAKKRMWFIKGLIIRDFIRWAK